jgi:hypothetical protein
MIYRVKDWDRNFEKAQTRVCRRMTWVALPNRHDGSGYGAVAAHERNCELFTAWVLIVEVASKMPIRGTLFKDGRALTARDLHARTRFPQIAFDLAFNVLVQPEIDWLEGLPDSETAKWTKLTEEAVRRARGTPEETE